MSPSFQSFDVILIIFNHFINSSVLPKFLTDSNIEETPKNAKEFEYNSYNLFAIYTFTHIYDILQ